MWKQSTRRPASLTCRYRIKRERENQRCMTQSNVGCAGPLGRYSQKSFWRQMRRFAKSKERIFQASTRVRSHIQICGTSYTKYVHPAARSSIKMQSGSITTIPFDKAKQSPIFVSRALPNRAFCYDDVAVPTMSQCQPKSNLVSHPIPSSPLSEALPFLNHMSVSQ